MAEDKKNILEGIIGEDGYTRIDIVKVAFMDYIVARQRVEFIQRSMAPNLPKHSYSKRVKGVKKKRCNSVKRVNTAKPFSRTIVVQANARSKYRGIFNELMLAQTHVNEMYERFEALAKQLTPAEQQSIITGQDLPVNVMAKSPGKQSIVTQINSSKDE